MSYDHAVRRGALACVFVVAFTAGCGLVVGIPDRSEGQSLTDASGAESSPVDSMTFSEATIDDGVTDTSSDTSEAAVDSDAAPVTSYCDTLSPKPTFCDDFEGTFATKWTKVRTATGTTLTFDPGESVGPPKPGHALFAATTMNDGTWLEKGFGSKPSTLLVAFDAYVEKFPATDTTFLARIKVGSSEYVALYALPSNTVLQEYVYHPDGGPPPDHTCGSSLDEGAWTRVEMQLDFGASPVTAKVRFNSSEVLNTTLQSDFYGDVPLLELGVPLVHKPEERHFRYDNVVIDLK